MYSRRILDLAMFFNYGIERVIYESPIRNQHRRLESGRCIHDTGVEPQLRSIRGSGRAGF